MMKFLHAADIHLDSPLRGLRKYEGAPVDEIRDAPRRALENLVDAALREAVDFVVIAGDLYDGNWKDFNTGLFFTRQIARLREAGIPLFLIAGNHDATNHMTRSLRLPANPDGRSPFLSDSVPETRTLEHLGVAIHGRSFASASEQANLALAYPAPIPGMFNLGVLHTSLEGDTEHDPYAPCSVADLVAKEYQYWALGHIHKRRVVVERPAIVYPGNIQGRHIRETGPKGAYLVHVDDRHAVTELRFVSLDVLRWERVSVDCQGLHGEDEIFERLRGQLDEAFRVNEQRPLVVRVEYRGATPCHDDMLSDRERWINQTRSLAIESSSARIWIEKVEFDVRSIAQVEPVGPADAALWQVCQDVLDDRETLWRTNARWSELLGKLPRELRDGPLGLNMDNTAWRDALIERVQALLAARLSGAASRATRSD